MFDHAIVTLLHVAPPSRSSLGVQLPVVIFGDPVRSLLADSGGWSALLDVSTWPFGASSS